MRLLLLAERFGPAGGMERYLDITVAWFRAHGDEVRILARTLDHADSNARELAWADEHDPGDPAAGDAVRDEIAAGSFDAVVVHNVLDAAVLDAARSARRLVYHLHDHRPFCPNGDRLFPRTGRRCGERMGIACAVHALSDGCMYGPRPRSLALIRRREEVRDHVAACDVVIANSPFVARRAHENGVAGAVCVAPPLPADAYRDAPAAGGDALLFVGRVEPQKGLRSLVRALATLPSAERPRLRVAGDGPDLAAAVGDARRASVAIEPLGRLDAAGVRAELDRCAALVVPSLWDEPFGIVGTEAFARGRPVVAYDVGGISWWLHDGENGTLVPAGDEQRLGAALHALRDATLSARLAGGAKRAGEAYRADGICAQLRALYAG